MSEPDNWDPEPGKEEWWRDCVTGDRGYRVRRNGVDRIRLDRPDEPKSVTRAFSGHRWTLDKDNRPLRKHNVAQVAYLADRLMAKFLGDHRDDRPWNELHEHERVEFMKLGPRANKGRNVMFEQIMTLWEPATK